jgi:hypothetical protein
MVYPATRKQPRYSYFDSLARTYFQAMKLVIFAWRESEQVLILDPSVTRNPMNQQSGPRLSPG